MDHVPVRVPQEQRPPILYYVAPGRRRDTVLEGVSEGAWNPEGGWNRCSRTADIRGYISQPAGTAVQQGQSETGVDNGRNPCPGGTTTSTDPREVWATDEKKKEISRDEGGRGEAVRVCWRQGRTDLKILRAIPQVPFREEPA